ncbi:hypothetical protein NHX12_034126, partial [Muraenolepis orangiensis]
MSLWRCFSCTRLLRSWVVLALMALVVAVLAAAAAAESSSTSAAGLSGSGGPLSWLLSDKGPFHHAQEFVDFTERYQQGFTTKYKIYRGGMKLEDRVSGRKEPYRGARRAPGKKEKHTNKILAVVFEPEAQEPAEFGRWKVNSLALERQENNGLPLPLDPDFLHTIRQLGRRPSLSSITNSIIRKYGTHFPLSATLGGEESLMIFVDKRRLSKAAEAPETNGTAVTLEALHQLAASYFIDRESTLRKLHHIQIASTAIK